MGRRYAQLQLTQFERQLLSSRRRRCFLQDHRSRRGRNEYTLHLLSVGLPHARADQSDRRWHSGRKLHCKAWSDGAVIFDEASGDTHYLTLSAWHVLALVLTSPRSISEIVQALANPLDAITDKDSPEIASVLTDLSALGLIELKSE